MPIKRPAVSISASARIAGIDRGVGLHEVVDRLGPSPNDRAHDALGHRLSDPERIADREHDVADRDVVDVGEGDGLQVVGVDLEEGQVRRGVDTDDLREVYGAVGARNGELRCLFDDVIVGDDVSVAVDDDARSEPLCDDLGSERQRLPSTHAPSARSLPTRRRGRPRRGS